MIAFHLCVLCCIGLATGKKYIFCSGDCNIGAPSKYCTAKEIEKPPWSKVGEKTAPKPELFNVGYYLYNISDKEVGIALNITWKSKVSTLKKLIKGYYLVVRKSNMMVSLKYRFNLTGMKDFKSRRRKVYFNYECAGKSLSFIRPGEIVTVDLQSLPRYQENHDSQHVTVDIKIPDCNDKEMLKTWHCLNYSEYYDSSEYVYERQIPNQPVGLSDTYAKGSSNNYALIILPAATGGALLALVIAAIIYWIYFKGHFQTAHDQRNNIVKGRCLVLVSSSSEDGSSLHKKAAHLLAEILNRDARLQVSCNLWLQTQMQEPVKWTTEALAASQHVVLVASHQPRQSCQSKQLEEPFEIGLAALLQSQRAIHIPFLQKQTFHLVYFAANRQQVLPRELSSFKRSYPLMKNFRGFYKGLTNRPQSTVDPQLRNSLSDVIARLRHLQSLDETSGLCPDLVSEMKPAALDGNRAQDANMVPWLQGDEATSSSLAFNSGFSSSSVKSHETSVSCQGSQCSCNNSVQVEQLISCL